MTHSSLDSNKNLTFGVADVNDIMFGFKFQILLFTTGVSERDWLLCFNFLSCYLAIIHF